MTAPSSRAPRPWGYWTEVKLQILSDYLDAFLTACQSQREVVYLDAFAGEGHGLSRVTGKVENEQLMAQSSTIEWTEATWNPVTAATR